MIKIYTSWDLCPKTKWYVKYNDIEFKFNYPKILTMMQTDEKFFMITCNALRNIDKAEVLDINTGTIITPFGCCSLLNISTGCKTFINCAFYCYRGYIPLSLDISECGSNAIEELFDTFENYSVQYVLTHTELPKSKWCFSINDKEFRCGDILAIVELHNGLEAI